jgi:hypothetical protein
VGPTSRAVDKGLSIEPTPSTNGKDATIGHADLDGTRVDESFTNAGSIKR